MRVMPHLVCLGCFSFVSAICISAQGNQADSHHLPLLVPCSSPDNKYFRDCTPAGSATHDCARLEGLFSCRLKDVDESPLSIQTNSGAQLIYRFSYATPVAEFIGMRLARIEIRNDSKVEIIAKTEDMNDRILTSRSLILPEADAHRILSLIRWEEFVYFDTANHSAPDRTHLDFDGDYCALEGTNGDKFHAVYRSQIEQNSSLDPAKVQMLRLYKFLNKLGVWRTK